MFFDVLLNLIFPAHCVCCERNTENGAVICGKCLAGISLNRTLFCGKCGARLPNNAKICHKDFPFILGAATSYRNDAVKKLVHCLKFKYIEAAATPLSDLLIHYAEDLRMPLEKFLVIPVPLSSKRIRERGFNQAEIIARIFAGHFGLTIAPDALSRDKHAKPQSETRTITERRANVAGSFCCHNQETVIGKDIILIDDVTTSGSTLLAAAETLKSAGAGKILSFAVAQA